MKTGRQVILYLGAAIILMMLLFPPFEFRDPSESQINNMGYGFLFDPPRPSGWEDVHAKVNIGMLLTQWVAVILICGILWLAQRDKENSSEPGRKWLNYWNYVNLPALVILCLTGASMKYQYAPVLIPMAVLFIAAGYGLHSRKLWGWSLNWVVIALLLVPVAIPPKYFDLLAEKNINKGKDLPKIDKLYDNLVKDNYDLPDKETFKNDMKDARKRQTLYNNLVKDNYDLPDFETFSKDIAPVAVLGYEIVVMVLIQSIIVLILFWPNLLYWKNRKYLFI